MNRLRKELKVASIPCDSPYYHWSSQSYTLSELVTSFTLPRVVMCAVESCYLNNLDFEFDLKQPLLIYTSRTARKLRTKCLEYNESQDSYVEQGPDVIIPEDYNGWFYLPDPEEDDGPPPCYEDAQAVAHAHAKAVITMSEATALHLPDSAAISGEDSYEPRPVEPGRILKVLQSDLTTRKMHKPRNGFANKTRFLKCFSESNDVLLIPYSSTSGFCELPLDGPDSCKFATMKDVMNRQNFPFRMYLVCGNLPPILDSFTGMMMAQSVISESTVMACTISISDPLLLELKMSSPVRFYLALNDFDIQQREEYLESLHSCKTNADEYLQNMKVAFRVSPMLSASDEEEWRKHSRNDWEMPTPTVSRQNKQAVHTQILSDFDDEEDGDWTFADSSSQNTETTSVKDESLKEESLKDRNVYETFI